jgi:glutaconate CoA-transferase subunit B
MKYTGSEIMLITAAREIQDGDLVVVGQGLPMAAAVTAKRFHAPNAILMTEAGMVDFDPFISPIHIADPTCTDGFSYSCDLIDIFTLVLNRGYVDVSFLGVGQIDRYGNINSTVIGDYRKPKLRLGGAGGAPEFLAYSKRAILTMRNGKFVEKLDYVSSPGYLDGGDARERSGHYFPNTGPSVLITTKGVFRFDKETKELYLDMVMPGVTPEEIQADVPWPLKMAEEVKEVIPPSEEEIMFIRSFDPSACMGRSLALKIIGEQLMKFITGRSQK